MISVIQRVSSASVSVGGRSVGAIGTGLVVLSAVEKGDEIANVEKAARKIAALRIFADEHGRMNLSLDDAGGAVLAISQFTLAGSISKGRRPSFDNAEDPERARNLFDHFLETLRGEGLRVETGEFGAMMMVTLENDGPVTFVLET